MTKPRSEQTDARSNPFAAGLLGEDRAVSMMDDAINLIVAVLVGSLLAAYLLPIAIDALSNASSSSWDSNVTQLWDLLPLIIVLAVFLLFVAWAVGVYRRRS